MIQDLREERRLPAVEAYLESRSKSVRLRHVGAVGHGILVVVDGTERSPAALEFAFRQASLRSLPLTVVHCHFDDVYADAMDATATTPGEDASGDGLGLELRQLALGDSVSGLTVRFPDVDVRLTLNRGLPDDSMVRSSRNMEMVVVGAHARGRLAGSLFLGVGRSVVEHARCIVAVVPDDQ